MPVISRFFGVAIYMYHFDHGDPHFHAVYGEYEVSVPVQSGRVHGTFPRQALRHVMDWAERHEAELLVNWDLAGQGKALNHIAPLE